MNLKQDSLSQIADRLGFPPIPGAPLVRGYRIDSRQVLPGDLFFALPGAKADGHQFLEEARARGGVAAVIKKGYQGPRFGIPVLEVEDVEKSLQDLARLQLSQEKAPRIIGVTGSVGKTTTKEFLATLLQARYRVGKTPENHNTKLTLPLAILNLRGDEEVLVLEMGMSEPGDLRRLVHIAPPEVAVLTKVALAHAAHFPGGLEEIARGKAEIFLSPKLRTAIFFERFSEYPGCVEGVLGEKVSFTLDCEQADYFLSPGEEGVFIDERGVRASRFALAFKLPHLLHNFLAAVSAARQMHMEWDEIHSQIPYLELPKMRFEQFEKEGVLWINDAYNANPESMRAALSSLVEPRGGGKRIGVLGVMSPLGTFSESAHREIGCFAQKHLDHLLVFGEEAWPLLDSFQEVKKPAELFTDLELLAKRLQSLVSLGDVVLIKGSRVMKMEQIFERLGLKGSGCCS
ncbi:MAG: UDP-N-acetylmuramoyl-tripeptide--D-alanyl-D-alanine ligase [Chlamydiia bacterium]|nr:UDP-N-acetylmuramoyl-tripeptide--D-alanyl-D-alanine ligase [Chlamydiia bacterium]